MSVSYSYNKWDEIETCEARANYVRSQLKAMDKVRQPQVDEVNRLHGEGRIYEAHQLSNKRFSADRLMVKMQEELSGLESSILGMQIVADAGLDETKEGPKGWRATADELGCCLGCIAVPSLICWSIWSAVT